MRWVTIFITFRKRPVFGGKCLHELLQIASRVSTTFTAMIQGSMHRTPADQAALTMANDSQPDKCSHSITGSAENDIASSVRVD